MEGYQVSNQCQALVRDECLVPTKDAPELAYARQSTAEKYIPDVYYKVSEFIVSIFVKKRRVRNRQRPLRVFQVTLSNNPRWMECFFFAVFFL